jgi:predicted nucleic acid-binding protein
MKALVDASTLLLLVKHADASKLADMATDLTTLDLATYEAGNGIWKQIRLLKSISEKDARATREALVGLLSRTAIVRGEELDHARAMDLAIKQGIAYYDACYVIAAESLKLPLATEDRRLAGSIAGRDVIGWKQLLGEE